MQVLHRPHLPRLISVSIAAAILTITISLALASGLSKINQPGNDTGSAVRESAPTLTLHTTAPWWASNPFASLLSRPLPDLWRTSSR
jgi:hypothetical protein